MNKVAVFVPCFNVARKIRKFLNSFDEASVESIHSLFCVDNSSTDSTVKILKNIKEKSEVLKEKLIILRNKKNYGLGGSHKIIFSYLVENDFTHCLIIPSNYKGSPAEITKLFIKKLSENPDVDVVFGRRTLDSKKNLNAEIVDRIGRNISHPFKHLLADYKFSDIGSRFLLLKIDALKDIPYKSLSDSKEFNLQLNVILAETQGLKVLEVELKKWAFSKVDPIKIIRYNSKLVKTMARYGINKYIFQKSGWRLFNDFPDNKEREYEVL